MPVLSPEEVKVQVRDHWDAQPCGSEETQRPKYSREYFDEIEARRYELEPYIFSFAQFTRHRGQKMLEVGIGAGTDFLQWGRAGAECHGVDLTPEAVEHARQRFALNGVPAADVRVADCENLPFDDNSFDLVYSWGVLHHTPDTAKAIAEVVRVLRPGGTGKLMLYHRHSLVGLYVWLKWGLLKGRPWRSVSWCFHHCVESLGTKAFTRNEVRRMLAALPVKGVQIATVFTFQDGLGRYGRGARLLARVLAAVAGRERAGFYMTIQFSKAEQRASGTAEAHA